MTILILIQCSRFHLWLCTYSLISGSSRNKEDFSIKRAGVYLLICSPASSGQQGFAAAYGHLLLIEAGAN